MSSAAWNAAHKEARAAYRVAHRQEIAAYNAAHRVNPEKRTAYRRKYKYGITQEQFDTLLAAQNGMCAGGCDREPTHLDHDHETGAIRGLLCPPCNLWDVLGRNRFTDPDLTPGEMDQLAALIGSVTTGPTAKAR